MKQRIYVSFLALAALTILLVSGIFAFFFGQVLRRETEKEVRAEAEYTAAICEAVSDPASFCALLGEKAASRITLIRGDGMVLYDSDADSREMENHLDRPEIREAEADGTGISRRLSETMRTVTYYAAVRLSDGSFIRVCAEHASDFEIFLQILPYLLTAAGVMMAGALFTARYLTRKFVGTINRIDLKHPEREQTFPELAPLLNRMAQQNRQIQRQMADLVEQERKFHTITRNMNEGLILLDAGERIQFLNDSLKNTLGAAQMDYTGKNISLFNRSRELAEVIRAALKGQMTDAEVPFYERKLHIYGNPVVEEEKVTGVVLFLVDVSEKDKAEKLRREFTANVSHELKTPLTSISGFAELIQTGMVQNGDIPVFAGKIRDEAGRLLVLINDIIKLSRMDEGQSIQAKELVDLAEVGRETESRLQPVAERQGVRLMAELNSVKLLGVRSMLCDAVYNLCENAIKYNRENGQVLLEIFEEEEHPIVRVTDTGIGIPPEHQERIFERFYRVDKSHSRQTGGTGLGLSIVKHVVEYHGGYIEIHSREGTGTVITLRF